MSHPSGGPSRRSGAVVATGTSHRRDRRAWLRGSAAAVAALGARGLVASAGQDEPTAGRGEPTRFQVACMTLPYARFPLDRALTGIAAAGYRHVARGTTRAEPGDDRTPVLAADAPPGRARELGRRCRDLGLDPLLMFSGVYPEAPEGVDVLARRAREFLETVTRGLQS